jgi:glycosyltransferase involved in cell wall biosynthesis
MNLLQITPGAGGMYCGNCFRDHALVAAWRRLGHEATMLPLYLPMRLDEEPVGGQTPVFYGGINVFLEQKLPGFARAPQWLRRWLASPRLLAWAAGRAAKTRPEQAGDLTLSMLRGEDGRQAQELVEMIDWIRSHLRPEIVCLSNGLLVGMARRLRAELKVPVVGILQGEDSFLDALPSPMRSAAWALVAERSRDVDLFLAPSRYYADRMGQRLGLSRDRLEVVPNGISLEGFGPEPEAQTVPVIGYFARMCPEKGLDTLIEAYVLLRQRGEFGPVRLRVGGGCGPGDEAFVAGLRARLAAAGYLAEVEFHPNLDRAEKQSFLRQLTVFSVPAIYGEAFGLYLIEAWASGLPVVQPRHGAFPELIESTGGGILCEPGSPQALADALGSLLADPERARALGRQGRTAVHLRHSAETMARDAAAAFRRLVKPAPRVAVGGN